MTKYLQTPLVSQRTRYRLEAVVWLLGIYASIGFVRPVCEALRRMSLLNLTVYSSAFVTVALFLRSLGYKKRREPLTGALIFLAVLFYAYGFYLVTLPEERLHFIQYGVLAFLIHRAIREDIQNPCVSYLLAFFLTAAFGWLDEGIQAVTPGRFYALRDVLLNAISAALGLFIAFILRRKRH